MLVGKFGRTIYVIIKIIFMKSYLSGPKKLSKLKLYCIYLQLLCY